MLLSPDDIAGIASAPAPCAPQNSAGRRTGQCFVVDSLIRQLVCQLERNSPRALFSIKKESACPRGEDVAGGQVISTSLMIFSLPRVASSLRPNA